MALAKQLHAANIVALGPRVHNASSSASRMGKTSFSGLNLKPNPAFASRQFLAKRNLITLNSVQQNAPWDNKPPAR
jgi:hypothetical protein